MSHTFEDYQNTLNELPQHTQSFFRFHGLQLMNMGFPPKASLIEQLHCKLEKEIFDMGKYFQLMDNQQEERYEVYSTCRLEKEEHVFLLDHQLSFKVPELRAHLYQNETLLARLQNMLQYALIKKDAANLEQENKGLGKLEETYEFMEITNPLKYIINKDTLCLSFYGNKITQLAHVEQLLQENTQLKMLWLNDNPLDENALVTLVHGHHTNIEVLNSKFTPSVGHFAVKMAALDMDAERFYSTPDSEIISLDFESRGVYSMAQDKLAEIGNMFPGVVKINMKDNSTD